MIAGIIGLGYWGRNVLRVITGLENITIKCLCDINSSSIEAYKHQYETTNNYMNILNDKEIDIVFIITPISSHYKIIVDCLEHKKHVFVEKPICKTMIELEYIIFKSIENNVFFFCDYIFNYSNKITNLKAEIEDIKDIVFIELNRDTHRIFYEDNIIYDLIPHDLTIIHKLFETINIKIDFIDKIYYNDEFIMKTTIGFNINNIKGIINTEFLSSAKNRKIKVICKDKIVLYDDTTDIIDIIYYDLEENNNTITKKMISHNKKICINYNEPLKNSIMDFIDIINNKDQSNYYSHIELNKFIVSKMEEINNS